MFPLSDRVPRRHLRLAVGVTSFVLQLIPPFDFSGLIHNYHRTWNFTPTRTGDSLRELS